MQILANGLVQITNNKTGEVKTVRPEELSSFSPILANNYARALAQAKAAKEGAGTGTGDPKKYLGDTTNYLDDKTSKVPTAATGFDPFAIGGSTTPDLWGMMGVNRPTGVPEKDPYEDLIKKEKEKRLLDNYKLDFNNVSLGDNGFILSPQTGSGLVAPGTGYSKIKL